MLQLTATVHILLILKKIYKISRILSGRQQTKIQVVSPVGSTVGTLFDLNARKKFFIFIM